VCGKQKQIIIIRGRAHWEKIFLAAWKFELVSNTFLSQNFFYVELFCKGNLWQEIGCILWSIIRSLNELPTLPIILIALLQSHALTTRHPITSPSSPPTKHFPQCTPSRSIHLYYDHHRHSANEDGKQVNERKRSSN
jgi:hypothetical protein